MVLFWNSLGCGDDVLGVETGGNSKATLMMLTMWILKASRKNILASVSGKKQQQ